MCPLRLRWALWLDADERHGSRTAAARETLTGCAQPTVDIEDAIIGIRVRGQEKGGVCDLFGSAYPSKWNLAAELVSIEV